eukprot:TRINITY_DN13425_c0_g1_i1.p2 TRINITY_DN13425_c0_g1~~TRINITY_DN13425_c0_g1_i1.p2  ORF type:complete len:115 (+),score=24.51 TRINITY_DN13425_c0_g1_i1:185-529(+)
MKSHYQSRRKAYYECLQAVQGSDEQDQERQEVQIWGFGWIILTLAIGFFVMNCYFLGTFVFFNSQGDVNLHPANELSSPRDYYVYYPFLINATIPVTLMFIYINWASLKFFRHN